MALVPLQDLELLEKVIDALEDDVDLPLIKERLQSFEETGEGISWKKVKSDHKL